MKIDDRRRGGNIEDRRGKGSGGKLSLGIGGTVVIAIIVWLLGGNPMEFISQQAIEGISESDNNYVPSAEEDRLKDLTDVVFTSTTEVWTEIFNQKGMKYVSPKMVIFSGATQSGCGAASSSTGPFYCPLDQTVYIDLSFFSEMQNQLGAGGDFAYAYVVAHEVGHHVQNQLGTLGQVQKQQQRLSQKESNQMNVRLELQADFYAGVWAYHDRKNFDSIDDQDIRNGLNAANQIGDDHLQMQSQGYTVPDAFNHGTSEQRYRWLKKGIDTGDISQGDTFSMPYSQL